MDFSMKSIKGFAADAATAFSRAVQYTEEKFGTSEKTEFDAHFDGLALRADRTEHWTERLVSRTDAVLQPNPNTRVEDYFFEKIDKRREHPSNLDLLGQDMIDAGADLGSGTPYGTALIKIGQAQQRLGAAEREFVRASMTTFVSPLKRFLEGDMKTIVKGRKILENKRLDLDACKSRLRKARSMESQANIFASASFEWKRRHLVLLSAMRILLVPLLAACVAPRGDPLLPGEGWSMFFSAVLGITNGIAGSVPMIVAPSMVSDDQKELTGNIMTLSYSIGLTLGLGVAYFIDYVLGPTLLSPCAPLIPENITEHSFSNLTIYNSDVWNITLPFNYSLNNSSFL